MEPRNQERGGVLGVGGEHAAGVREVHVRGKVDLREPIQFREETWEEVEEGEVGITRVR